MEKPLAINEQIFNYVLTWPGHTPQSYADQLNKSRGFNIVTVVTCINQMVRANMCRKDSDNRVQVIVPKYSPIPSTKKLQQMDKKKAKEATKIILPRTIEHAKTILEQAKIEVPVPKQPSNTLTAAYVLENISLGEGVKLFEALTRAFKG